MDLHWFPVELIGRKISYLIKIWLPPSDRFSWTVYIRIFVSIYNFEIGEVFWENPMFSQIPMLDKVFIFNICLWSLLNFLLVIFKCLFNFSNFLFFLILLPFYLDGFRILEIANLVLNLVFNIYPLLKSAQIFLCRPKAINDFNSVNRRYSSHSRRVIWAHKKCHCDQILSCEAQIKLNLINSYL